MNKKSLPFKIKDVFEGFAESSGILRLEDESVWMEFQTKDAIFGAIKSEPKKIEILISDIEELDFKKSIFGSKLTIRLSKIGDYAQIPNQDAGEIVVSIERRNVEAALSFVSGVKLEVVDQKIRDLEDK